MGTNYYAHKDDRDDRIHLTKTSGGWEPAIQWHAGVYGCSCECNDHHYRNWEEFKEFVRQEDITVINEYGEEVDSEELIEKLIDWTKGTNRSQIRKENIREGVEIDGWEFLGGNWC